MKISLKNVKYYAGLSEETNAFTASVYFEGKKVGECENRGNGGETFVSYNSPEDREKVLEHVKGLPRQVVKADPDVGILEDWSYELSDGSVCDLLLEDELTFRRVQRDCRKAVIVLEDGQFFEYRWKFVRSYDIKKLNQDPNFRKWVVELKEKSPESRILNGVSREEFSQIMKISREKEVSHA